MGDILRWFRSCFYCKGKGELLYVVQHPAYDFTKHYYYHEECLKTVLCNPERYADLIDTAIDIANGIELEEARRKCVAAQAQKACERAREIYQNIYE